MSGGSCAPATTHLGMGKRAVRVGIIEELLAFVTEQCGSRWVCVIMFTKSWMSAEALPGKCADENSLAHDVVVGALLYVSNVRAHNADNASIFSSPLVVKFAAVAVSAECFVKPSFKRTWSDAMCSSCC